MSWMAEDVTFALQFGTLGLSLGVYLGHSVTNWLWKQRMDQRIEELKLERVESLFDANKQEARDLCVCGHMREDHRLVFAKTGVSWCLHYDVDAGRNCRCKKFKNGQES